MKVLFKLLFVVLYIKLGYFALTESGLVQPFAIDQFNFIQPLINLM